MTELRRLELALAVLVTTAALLTLVIALDTVLYHGIGLVHDSVVLTALAVLDALVIARAARSAVLQLRASRAVRRRLPAWREALVGGRPVRVLPGGGLEAFCAGLLRPAIYVTEGTVRAAGDAELVAIVAHEAHHRARRDPLRLLIARTVADALRPLPPFASLAGRYATLAELSADDAAVRATGGAGPLASALVRFDATRGIEPARVDRLVREWPSDTVSWTLLAAAGLVLAGVAGLVAPMLGGWHPDLALPAPAEPPVLVLACMPACLAASRVGACLRVDAAPPS